MGSGLDVKIFLWLQAAGVEQGFGSSGWCFSPPLVQSLSDRFLMRQQIPFGIDFYVRQRGHLTKLKRGSPVRLKQIRSQLDLSQARSARMLPMDNTVCETLKVLPSGFKKGYVFPSPVGEGQPLYDCRKQFSNAVKQAGIHNFRFHDLRHTFASHLVMNAVDIKTVQELLGHATLTMTMRYSYLAPDHCLRAIKTLDSAYRTDTITDTVENPSSKQSG